MTSASFRHISTSKSFAKRYALSSIGFALLFENAGKFYVAHCAKNARLMRSAGFSPVSILG